MLTHYHFALFELSGEKRANSKQVLNQLHRGENVQHNTSRLEMPFSCYWKLQKKRQLNNSHIFGKTNTESKVIFLSVHGANNIYVTMQNVVYFN
jgi:hypothetical protein